MPEVDAGEYGRGGRYGYGIGNPHKGIPEQYFAYELEIEIYRLHFLHGLSILPLICYSFPQDFRPMY